MSSRPNSNSSGSAGASESPGNNGGVSKMAKLMLLVVLCMQNAVYTMLRRYSTGVLKETWSSSSVLMVGEIMKLAVSIFMTLADSGTSSAEGTGLKKLWWLVLASVPMAVPAVVFWLMNLLSYVSLKRVDASTFTVCAQMKILTTAVFSMLLLGRTFHVRKWRALVLLVLGVTLVSNGSYVPSSKEDGEGDETKSSSMQYVIGVAAVLTEVTLSGFVSVFFEKVLKSRVVNLSVWDRNFQLAMYSIAFYLPVTMLEEESMFAGWTVNAVIVSVLGGAGGLLVAFTMKYTDAVLKTFSTSGAIIVTAVAGHMLLNAPLDIPIAVGACCTVLSLLNYSDDGGPGTSDKSEKRDASSSAAAVTAKGDSGKGRPMALPGVKPGMPEYLDESTQSLISRSSSPRDSAA